MEREFNNFLKELENLCRGRCDDNLSIDTLKEIINCHAPLMDWLEEYQDLVDESYFFHNACWNCNVTLEIIQYLLNTFPSIKQFEAKRCDFFHNACGNSNMTLEIIEYLLTIFPNAAQLEIEHWDRRSNPSLVLPLHFACDNKDCPASVIKLLVEKYPAALQQFAIVYDGLKVCGVRDEPGFIAGLPLHYYLSRSVNVDIDVVQFLVQKYPQSLWSSDDEMDVSLVWSM